ncbi:hypothetical protein GOP47_0025966, partial [Adiantum capillus-veneris]
QQQTKMAIAWRCKGFVYMRRALKCSSSLPSSCRDVRESCLEAHRMLGGAHGLASSRENGGEHVNDTKSSKQVLEISLGSAEHMATPSNEGSSSASLSSSETLVLLAEGVFFMSPIVLM